MVGRRELYSEQGFLVVKGLFAREAVDAAAREADRLARHPVVHPDNLRCRWQTHPETGDPLLDALDPVLDLAPDLAEIVHHPRLLATLEELLGDRPVLFKDKLILKPPGAIGHPWHQDFIAWPGFPRTFTTALIALDPATRENGRLEVFSGAHRKGCLSPQDGDYHDLAESFFPRETRVPLDLEPGDVAVFGCYLPHGSGPNRSSAPRRHLYFSYNAAGDGGDRRARHYEQFHAWLAKRYAEYGGNPFFFK